MSRWLPLVVFCLVLVNGYSADYFSCNLLYTTHVGDTCQNIAARYGISVAHLRRKNKRMTCTRGFLRPGLQLCVNQSNFNFSTIINFNFNYHYHYYNCVNFNFSTIINFNNNQLQLQLPLPLLQFFSIKKQPKTKTKTNKHFLFLFLNCRRLQHFSQQKLLSHCFQI